MVDLVMDKQQLDAAGKGVPAGWVQCKLGDVLTLQRGFDLPQRLRKEGNIPIISSSGESGWHNKAIISPPGIVTGRYGTIGEVFFIDRPFWPLNTTLYVREFNGITPFYAYFLLKTVDFQSHSGKSGVPGVNRNDVHQENILLPPIKEQIAITTTLSNVDELIRALERLLSKKQAIKTATMQKLLTGKTRLPQFALRADGTVKGYKKSELGEIPEDWTITLLNDVIDSCSSGATPYRGISEYYKGNNRWITSGELNYCIINDTIEKISDSAIKDTNLKIHPAGTFLMAITGLEAAGTRGACGIVGKPSATNQSCMAIYPNNKLDSNYLYHWYVYNGETLAFKYCQGTKQLSYTAGLIRKIPLFLPTNKKEQTAIAAILSDMDKDIQTLQQRLDKTRQLKQGMMQELLTGKTRLI
ncbi:restriction endonuclease subunit S [Cronobacter turicensis]|nr:restriction endonuclease subunit S [Cronobacter turicensis]EKM0436830.1 restriction endonuclease subunit S [Cronobacter turicensis]ELY4321084.1 restriction endonuclease subunit S [Cronobacter turicensis]ELY5942061.1 restriction endonuclease subunit S [Cronobacter turicensis]ELY5962151.1 restriction endonuclease subunit S [Cronobacter turicensis]